MAEEVTLDLKIDSSQSVAAVKSLKQQFTEAEDALFALAGAGKEGTKEFRNAQLEAAKLKERVDDINESLDDLKPEATLGAFGKVAGGVASGFAAATGAAALFGAESEDLQKTLVKVQAAMAFSDGLRNLGDLSDGFKTLQATLGKTAIGQRVLTAIQWAYNAALNANPIGLFIIALAALTAGIYLLVDAEEDELKIEKALLETQKKRNEEREIELSHLKRLQKIKTGAAERAIALAKAQGKSESELYELEKDLANKRIADLLFIREARGKLNADENNELANLYNQRAILKANFDRSQRDKEKANRKEAKTEKKEDAKVEEEDEMTMLTNKFADKARRQKESDDYTKAAQEKAAAEKKALDDKARDEKLEADKQAAAEEQALVTEKFELTKTSLNATQALTDAVFSARLNSAKKGSKEEEKIAKQQFNVNKAMNLTMAAINGVQAIQAITATAVDPTGITTAIRIGASVALTAANIAKIASSKFTSSGGGGVSAPSLNAPSTSITKLTDNTDQPRDRPIIKTFVVESDITTAQNNVKGIEERATY